MGTARLWIVGACVLLATASPSFGGPRAKGPDQPGEDLLSRDVQALADKIDQAIAARWAAAKVQEAPVADDAAFARRVYLDVAGRIPSVAEVRTFLEDKRPDKRQRLVQRLLAGPAYVRHFTDVWRHLLMPETSADFQVRYMVPLFEAWVRKQFVDNVSYDKLVRELLTAGVDPQQYYGPQNRTNITPSAFYLAKEVKPENLGASTARLFLGINLECAQCHDHPFARWTRSQFWEFAAFFAGLEQPGNRGFFNQVNENFDRRELTISGGNQVVQAAFLDGKEPQWKYKVSSRVTLADWMTSADNPFFARAAANRLWAHFFGIGIVEPVDDLTNDKDALHRELLDELGRQFAAHQYDFKFLIRAITSSRTYQLVSETTHPSQDDPRLFARMPVRGLTAEQLFDSLAQATGYRQDGNLQDEIFFGNQSVRSEFLTKFASQDKKTEFQTSILQALSLMNGKFIADATSIDKSATLAAVADAPFLDTAQRIETLCLATIGRLPRSDEVYRLHKYVSEGGPKKNAKGALADVFWALLNSSEFMLNH